MIFYILDTFPNLSETFILREILALKKSGKKIKIISLKKPVNELVHPEVLPLLDDVIYTEDFSFYRKLWDTFLTLLQRPFLCLKLDFSLLADLFFSPRFAYHRWRGIINAIAIAKDTFTPPNQIHAHFAYVSSDVAKVLAEIFKCQWSVSAHAWDIFTQAPRLLNRRLKTADKIFVCSKHGKQVIASKAPAETDKIRLMYHGIETEKFAGKSSEGYIVSIGRLEKKKGFDVLIQAGQILVDQGIEPNFTIIGEGPLKKDLKNKVKQLGLQNFNFAGSLAFDEVKKKLASAMLLVQPSVVTDNGDHDGIPNVLLEAMALAKPVITTDVGGITELVENGVNGVIVKTGEAEQLADAIKKLIKNQEKANKIGTVAREYIKEHFEVTENIKPLNDYFEEKIRQ